MERRNSKNGMAGIEEIEYGASKNWEMEEIEGLEKIYGVGVVGNREWLSELAKWL